MSEADADSRMNILFVHENTGPSGGAETNIQITAEELKARGHRLALLYSSPKSGMPWQKVFPETFCLDEAQSRSADFQSAVSPISNRQTLENPRDSLPSARHAERSSAIQQIGNLRYELAEFAPDIIYIHKVRNLDLFEALLRTGIPTVRMVHDHEMYCLRQYKYNPLTRAICTRSASGFCVSPALPHWHETAAAVFQSNGPATPIDKGKCASAGNAIESPFIPNTRKPS
jgi:hypothetical protein